MYKRQFEHIANYELNKKYKVKVVKLMDFGAFCELEPGLSTLLHSSELSWTKKNPSAKKMFRVGDEIECVITEIDKEKRRVAISHRLTIENPYNILEKKYPVGSEIEGVINSTNEYAIYIKLNDLDNDGQSIIENFEKSLFDLAEKGSFSSSIVKFDDAVKMSLETATNAYKNEEGLVGVPTGLTDIDDRLGGLHKSDLIIIAGRPSMGKTALATNIAFNAAKKMQDDNKKSSIAFFSLEMSSEQLSTRILAEQSRIKSNDIRRGRMSEEEFDKYIETSKNIKELPLYIDETPAISIAALSNRARRIKRLYGLDMVVVDYIQLMRASNFKEGRVQEISEITQGLKALAKELDVPVLALSQLSRQVEQRDNKKPQLSDLRESGSIEQDADVVMFVYSCLLYTSPSPRD